MRGLQLGLCKYKPAAVQQDYKASWWGGFPVLNGSLAGLPSPPATCRTSPSWGAASRPAPRPATSPRPTPRWMSTPTLASTAPSERAGLAVEATFTGNGDGVCTSTPMAQPHTCSTPPTLLLPCPPAPASCLQVRGGGGASLAHQPHHLLPASAGPAPAADAARAHGQHRQVHRLLREALL